VWSQNLYVETLIQLWWFLEVKHLRGSLVIRVESSPIKCPQNRGPESELTLSYEKAAVCKPGKEPSPKPNCAGTVA
jgi:hypothetical protein